MSTTNSHSTVGQFGSQSEEDLMAAFEQAHTPEDEFSVEDETHKAFSTSCVISPCLC